MQYIKVWCNYRPVCDMGIYKVQDGSDVQELVVGLLRDYLDLSGEFDFDEEMKGLRWKYVTVSELK